MNIQLKFKLFKCIYVNNSNRVETIFCLTVCVALCVLLEARMDCKRKLIMMEEIERVWGA